ncbi:MAG TPA: MlaD family protein [Mycobacteriales bacterium]
MNGKTLRATIYLSVFTVITVFLTYVLAVTIENGSVGSTRTYRAAFTDTTSLLTGDDVRIAGVRVGQIKSIKLIEPHSKDASLCRPAGATTTQYPTTCSLVTFGLDKSIPLATDATAELKYLNLVGQRYLDIQETPGPVHVLPKGGLIPINQTTPALDLTVLFDGFRPLFQALDPEATNQLSYEIVAALQGEGGTLESLLASTGQLSNTIATQDAAIGSLITNLSGVLGTVDARDNELTNLVDQLQRLTTGLAGDRDAIASSLSNVNLLAVSTTKLLESIRPALPADLEQLSGVAHTLATTNVTVNGQQQNQLDNFLNYFPSKIDTITRTATYGGYFNFYLCQANIVVSPSTTVSLTNNNTKACAP